MYNPVALSTFTMLYDHHNHLFPGHFHHPKQKLCTHDSKTFPSFSPVTTVMTFLKISSAFILIC